MFTNHQQCEKSLVIWCRIGNGKRTVDVVPVHPRKWPHDELQAFERVVDGQT